MENDYIENKESLGKRLARIEDYFSDENRDCWLNYKKIWSLIR